MILTWDGLNKLSKLLSDDQSAAVPLTPQLLLGPDNDALPLLGLEDIPYNQICNVLIKKLPNK